MLQAACRELDISEISELQPTIVKLKAVVKVRFNCCSMSFAHYTDCNAAFVVSSVAALVTSFLL